MDNADVASHFRFGENWRSFQKIVDQTRINEAVRGLEKLASRAELRGSRFLDIGCGSGLSMLAALRLGASTVLGIDIDSDSISSARDLLSRFASDKDWQIHQHSVFDLEPATLGTFDVVYSWGVLHHTGDMWKALTKAEALVKRDGLFLLALYHKTPLCCFWRSEKRFYAHAPEWEQRMIRLVYKGAYLVRIAASGRDPRRYILEYQNRRGMDWDHDVHDWLGGYPYESALPAQVVPRLEEAGFSVEQVFENCAGCYGIFGSGCDEYRARRKS